MSEIINNNLKKINILIYGAGDAGKLFYKSILKNKMYNVCGFIDDSERLYQKKVFGIHVINKKDVFNYIKKKDVKGVIFAMPSISSKKLIDLSKFFLNHDLFIAKVPDISELLSNQKEIYQIKQFTTKDFLTRSEVDTDLHNYKIDLKKKIVAVTGGAGSIGSELCFQLLSLGVKKLIIIDYHEFSLFELVRNLQKKFS